MKQTEQARNPLLRCKAMWLVSPEKLSLPGMMIPIYPNANGHMMSYGYPYNGFSWFFREVNGTGVAFAPKPSWVAFAPK
jgi:hypothetical protein